MNAKLIILTDSKTSEKIAINSLYITTLNNADDGTTYVRVRDDYTHYVKESIDQIVELVNL